MIHFGTRTISLDYLAVLQMFLIALKLQNRIPWSWFMVLSPYIISGTLVALGAFLYALGIVAIDDED